MVIISDAFLFKEINIIQRIRGRFSYFAYTCMINVLHESLGEKKI